MYFFTQLNHEGGSRTVRKAGDGSWKPTDGRKPVKQQGKEIGSKMNLKFYKGSGPNAEKTDWLMIEYRLNKDDLLTMKTTTKADRENVEGKDDHRNRDVGLDGGDYGVGPEVMAVGSEEGYYKEEPHQETMEYYRLN
ncbi:NAC domain-containing protein 43-like [Magnolia sinica]|uniref:NAC domain-containing protein 43-like n=1 Tax=Magnolia sinica TaxID=86752 RepID=UPI002659B654|nr:NAC domain-containing protein 43-like [Magnolia sinica]